MSSGKHFDRPPVPYDENAPKRERFEVLVRGYGDDLYRYAYWLCHDKQRAEDVVQDTWTRVWKSLDKLRDPKAVKGWLFTIVRREHARFYERIQPQYADTEPEDLGIAGEYDTRAEAFALRNALELLAEEYREPLLMQVIGGLSCDEIAKALDISRSAVMTRLFRARKQMRLVLTGDVDGPRDDPEP